MTTTNTNRWQFWIDRGGTFTDVVARAPDGALTTAKLLSENPEQYPDAAVAGIRQLLGVQGDAPTPTHLIEVVKMGTTVATNALLERKGERTVLFTTRGFADGLRIAYQNRPRLFDRHIVLPEQLYSAVYEVDERLDAKGEVVTALDTAQAKAQLQAAFDAGYRCAAIAFMHAYKNPAHEQAVAKLEALRKAGVGIAPLHGAKIIVFDSAHIRRHDASRPGVGQQLLTCWMPTSAMWRGSNWAW